MSQEPSSGRHSVVLVVGLLVALAIGAAASLLIGSATSSGHPPIPPSELIVPNEVVAYALLGTGVLLLLVFSLAVYRALRHGRRGPLGRPIVSILMVVLLAILFVVAARLFLGGGPLPSGAVPTGVNSTGGSSQLGGTQGNLTNSTGAGNFTPFLVPGVPGWVPYVVVVGIIMIVTVVAVPRLRESWGSRRAGRETPLDRTREDRRVREALSSAATELEGGGDPRDVIVRLYGRLLARLQPMVGSVDPHTPEEIRALHLERLGIRPVAAERLTRLFEEARYSSHRLSEGTVLDARNAIGAALEDLARSGDP